MSAPIKADIKAVITLLPPSEGGRGSAIHGEYRGVLAVGPQNFSMRFFASPECGIAPGQTENVEIQFLDRDFALPHFSVGSEFGIWEGRIIGNGKVLELPIHA